MLLRGDEVDQLEAAVVRVGTRTWGVAALAVGVAAGAAATSGGLAAISPGEWRFRDAAGAVRRLCVTDPGMLAQIDAGAAAGCTRRLLSSDARSATIAYTCPGAGQGRTTITVDSPEQVRLQTQGVAGGQPFDASYTGALVGRCG